MKTLRALLQTTLRNARSRFNERFFFDIIEQLLANPAPFSQRFPQS